MARKSQSSFDGAVLHFGAVRLRAVGSGILRMQLLTLNPAVLDTQPNLTLANPNDVEPVVLSNLTTQRAQLYGTMTAIDENFIISKIVVFIRPVATGYPQ